jgi:hypothetical protein
LPEKRPLVASEVERILRVYLRLVGELPPDTEAGYLDEAGHLNFAPDIGKKIRAAREVRAMLDRMGKGGG